MEPNNPIFEYLQGLAGLDLNERERAYRAQQLQDARTVKCVRMRDAFTAEQLALLAYWDYTTRQKMCYKNAAELVRLIALDCRFPGTVRYVEGIVYCDEVPIPIEHAFVKFGELYVDPTFERALHRDPRKELYVSLIELDALTMAQYQGETGHYGDLYAYKWAKDNAPELADRMRRW